MRVEVFSGSAGLRTLAPAWRSLTSQLKFKRHHHHVEWYLALAETFEQHKLAPLRCIAVFSASNVLVAVFPCRYMRLIIGAIELKVIRLVSDHSENNTARDVIMASVLHATDFFQEFLKYLAQHDPVWDVVLLEGLLEDAFATVALQRVSQLPRFQTPGGWGRMEFISCGDEDRPFERLSRGFKQNLRTAHNKLESEDVTFEVARMQGDVIRLFPDFLKVESSGWKGELGTSALKEPPTSTFLHQLMMHFGPSAGCEIHVMRVSDQPIASLFGIVTDNVWFIVRTGYDESYHRISPGHLIIENLLKQRATNKGFNTLTPYNAPPWFHAWKPDRILKVYDSWVFRPSSRGSELANQIAMIMRHVPIPTLQWSPA